MKWLYITTGVLFAVGIIAVSLDKSILSRFKHKDRRQTVTKGQNNEICVLCGAQIPCESGKQYCKECERKFNNSYEI